MIEYMAHKAKSTTILFDFVFDQRWFVFDIIPYIGALMFFLVKFKGENCARQFWRIIKTRSPMKYALV